MKKESSIKIIIIVLLIIILVIMLFKYNSRTKSNLSSKEINIENVSNNIAAETNIVSTKTQIQSALTENISLHATYYLKEIYVTTNQTIKQGENILQYTNGEYLTAPYDCVINEINVPEYEEECKNDNYVNISSINRMQITISINEDSINKIYIGQESTITVTSLNEDIIGYVTYISSTANNGNFTVIVQFNNDYDIKIGMSATVKI